jgi:Short C-terminal domain
VALLSGMIRTAAITGSTQDSVFVRIAGRQGGAWAQRTVGAAMPTARPAAGASPSLRDLTDLRDRGVITDAEFDRLRSGARG